MEYGIYCVRDILVGFGPLILEYSDESAIRNFCQLAGLDNVPIADYDLYCMGSYNTKSGLIEGFSVPRLVCHGASLARKEDKTDAVE